MFVRKRHEILDKQTNSFHEVFLMNSTNNKKEGKYTILLIASVAIFCLRVHRRGITKERKS